MIIHIFSTHFLLQSSQKSASKYIFCEKYEDFSFFDPLNSKNYYFQQKKRPFEFITDFNNQQNFLIFGLVTVNKNQKNLWRPDF